MGYTQDSSIESSIESQYDTTEYPAAIRRDWLSNYPNYGMDSHWHDEVELISVLRGKMRCNINGEMILISEEEGIFINARQVHDVCSVDKKECEFISVRFHPMLLCSTKGIEKSFVQPVIENPNYPYQILKSDYEWQRTILDALSRVYYMRHEITLELGAQGQFFAIWEQLFLHSGKVPAKRRPSSPQLSKLKEMISYIAANYKGKVTLEDLRQVGSMGKTNCVKVFQKYLNMTPIQYITMYRLRKGAELLTNSDLPVVEVAEEVGFSGASYFSEAFRQHMGEMPSEYRKKHARREGLR